jgi:hypothetical protein
LFTLVVQAYGHLFPQQNWLAARLRFLLGHPLTMPWNSETWALLNREIELLTGFWKPTICGRASDMKKLHRPAGAPIAIRSSLSLAPTIRRARTCVTAFAARKPTSPESHVIVVEET